MNFVVADAEPDEELLALLVRRAKPVAEAAASLVRAVESQLAESFQRLGSEQRRESHGLREVRVTQGAGLGHFLRLAVRLEPPNLAIRAKRPLLALKHVIHTATAARGDRHLLPADGFSILEQYTFHAEDDAAFLELGGTTFL